MMEPLGNPGRFKLLLEVSETEGVGSAAFFLRHVLWMAHDLGESVTAAACDSTKKLSFLHEALTVRVNKLATNQLLSTSFPPPPFEGTRDIVPIARPIDLLERGCRPTSLCG